MKKGTKQLQTCLKAFETYIPPTIYINLYIYYIEHIYFMLNEAKIIGV